MPVVILPPDLATDELSSVAFTTATLLARPGRATLLARILEECDIPAAEASQWTLTNNTRERVLTDEELRLLTAHARVHLSRVGALRPPQFVELRNEAATAQGRSAGREVANYISAEPRHDFMDFLGIVRALAAAARSFCACGPSLFRHEGPGSDAFLACRAQNASVFDALLEWLDNAIKSLHTLPAGAPREIYYGFHVGTTGTGLHFFVRDSGAGMARERLEVWPSLSNAARAEPEPPSSPEGDPRAPYSPGLGQWRVGAKTGLAVMTGEAGRTEVYTRAAGLGIGGPVAYLIFDKAVAKARDEAARAAGGRAEPGQNWCVPALWLSGLARADLRALSPR